MDDHPRIGRWMPAGPLSRRTGALWVGVAAILVAGGVTACSFIQFEDGPYVIRDLRVVYSQQEDVTFLSWKLRRDAKRSLVDFELYRDGAYRPIDLSAAPFPADPWECGDNRICFQYQVPGDYEVPGDRSPLRSRHVDEGTFAGPEPEVRDVETTFDIEPIALGRNEQIDPELEDWFDENGVPLQRDWEWQFVPREGDACGSTESPDWSSMGETVSVDYGWVDRTVCFASRPDRHDAPGTEVKDPLPPSAETEFGRQTYRPEAIDAPIVYGILLDLVVASEARCKDIKETLLPTIQNAVEGRGDSRNLGVFTPRSRETGESLNGCNQEPGRRYPVADMIQEATETKQKLDPTRVRVLWIYVNNVPLQPDEQTVTQVRQLTSTLPEENDLPVYNWAIGSNAVLSAGPWDHRTGWRPVEDDTFVGDIQAFAEDRLPFKTMDHEDDREIPIEPPDAADDPKAFKICQSTPVPVSKIGVESGRPEYSPEDPHAPWPETGRPFFQITLQPQILVPKLDYREVQIDLVVEVCERFCDNPFRTRGGAVYDNWKETPGERPMEVCQWRE